MSEPLIASWLRHWLAERDAPPASGSTSSVFIELADVRELLAWIDEMQNEEKAQ